MTKKKLKAKENITDTYGEIVIYKKQKNSPQVDVRFAENTIWLSQKQMAELFEKDTDTIGLHIKNIYNTKELCAKATTEYFSVVQEEGKRKIKRKVKLYNLDVIISVGYRVSSKRGTEFRIWAGKILRKHLAKEYAIHENILETQTNKIKQLEKTVGILSNVFTHQTLDTNSAIGLLKVIRDYTYALDLLNQYDHSSLSIQDTNNRLIFEIDYDEAMNVISKLKMEFQTAGEDTSLFGKEKDDSFKGSIYDVYQTHQGQDLYPSIEEKAASTLGQAEI